MVKTVVSDDDGNRITERSPYPPDPYYLDTNIALLHAPSLLHHGLEEVAPLAVLLGGEGQDDRVMY